jgi:PAS domain-containing protein
MGETDASRRWTRQISHLRTRVAKVRRGFMSPEVADALDECLATCDALLWDVAGAELRSAAVRAAANLQQAAWHRLFDQMPVACLEVDAAGSIVCANGPAALMLNLTVKHLENRLLLHFAEDRGQFASLVRRVLLDGAPQRAAIRIRPRERAALDVQALIVPRNLDDPSTCLWFLNAGEPSLAGRRKLRRPEMSVNDDAKTVLGPSPDDRRQLRS